MRAALLSLIVVTAWGAAPLGLHAQDPDEEIRRRRPSHYQPPAAAAPYSYGQLQRPYPYHLDYYRMRYGGSYAPYFGNLYGPPQFYNFPGPYGPLGYGAGRFGGAYYW
jgi:hypothetical protein